jgi:hypothetical protein
MVPAAQINEQKPIPASAVPGNIDDDRPQGSSSVGSVIASLVHGIIIVFCYPCVYCCKRRQYSESQGMALELPIFPAVVKHEAGAVSAETAYHNLELYGPVGITEMPGDYEAVLPAPRILDTYFGE